MHSFPLSETETVVELGTVVICSFHEYFYPHVKVFLQLLIIFVMMMQLVDNIDEKFMVIFRGYFTFRILYRNLQDFSFLLEKSFYCFYCNKK